MDSSYAVKYIGVVNGEVAVQSRRVNNHGSPISPLSPSAKTFLRPSRLVERIL